MPEECIQEVTKDTVIYLRAMHIENFQQDYDDIFYASLPNSPVFKGYILVIDGCNAGEVIIKWFVEHNSLCAYIISFSIMEKYRGQGYGNKLFQFTMDKTKECFSVYLHVRVTNYVALSLYTKFGFEAIEIIDGYYDDEDGYLMIRNNSVPHPEPPMKKKIIDFNNVLHLINHLLFN